MAFWWKKTPKTPSDYIKVLNEQLQKLESSSISIDNKKKAQEECSKYLDGMKHILLLDDTTPTCSVDLLYDGFFKTDCLTNLMSKFMLLDFESRKNISVIFSTGLGKSVDNKSVYVDYLITKPQIIKLILKTLEDSVTNSQIGIEVYLCVGTMVDECLKFEQLSRIILNNHIVWSLFDNCLSSSFEISTQSFQLLNTLFTSFSKLIATEFFNNPNNMQKFTLKINKLLAHGNYVTKRQAVKLLSTLMMNRVNYQFMLSYINNADNLKLIMVLLSDRSKNLQIEAFNVFKIFVANPKKNKSVFDILIKNKDKLLKFFQNFGDDTNESAFLDEKNYILKLINDLPRIIVASTSSTHSSSPNGLQSISPTSL